MKKIILIVVAAVALYMLTRYILDEKRGWRDEQEVYPCECHNKH